MVTGPSAPRPVPQARIEPVDRDEDDLDQCPTLNTRLIRGLPNGNIARPNPAGQVFLTLAMLDPSTAFDPDLSVLTPVPVAQQQAAVFSVASDLLRQQHCLNNKVQLSEVLNWLRLVARIEQANKDEPAFSKQSQRLATNRTSA